MNDLDDLPTNLPPLPVGVTFAGYQELRGDRLWAFTDAAVTRTTFYTYPNATESDLVDAVRGIRRKFARAALAERVLA